VVHDYGLDNDVYVEEGDDIVASKMLTDASTSTYPDNPVRLEDIGIQNVAFTLDTGVQTVINRKQAEIQTTVTTKEASTKIDTKLLRDKDISTSTDDLKASLPQFNISILKMMIKQYCFTRDFLRTCFC